MLNWLRTKLRYWLGIQYHEDWLVTLANANEHFAQRDYDACQSLNTAIVEQGKSLQKQVQAVASDQLAVAHRAEDIDRDMAPAKRMLGLLPDPELRGTRTIPMELEHLRNRALAIEKRLTPSPKLAAALSKVGKPKPRTKAKKR